MPDDQQIINLSDEKDDNKKEKPCSSKQAMWKSRNLAHTLNKNYNLENKYTSDNNMRHNLERSSPEFTSRKIVKDVPTKVQSTGTISELPVVSKQDTSDSRNTKPRRHSGNEPQNAKNDKQSALLINSADNIQTSTNKSNRKRRGKPTPTSNTKRAKKLESVTAFYDGKLSNVVPFGRYYASSDSDLNL